MGLENLRKTIFLREVMSWYTAKSHYQISIFKNNVLYIFTSKFLNVFNNDFLPTNFLIHNKYNIIQ